MFTFSLLVPIAQDKDLELSYCILSVCIIGSSRIVVISQDMTIWKELKQLQPQDQHHQQSKTGNSLVQTSPPPEELLTEVREDLIQPSFMEQIPSIQDLQQDSQVFDTEHLSNLHTPNISIERTYFPPVICND